METDIAKKAGKLKWWHLALIAAGASFIGGLPVALRICRRKSCTTKGISKPILRLAAA